MARVFAILIGAGFAAIGGLAHPMVAPVLAATLTLGFGLLAARRLVAPATKGIFAAGVSVPALLVCAAVVLGATGGRALQHSADAAQAAIQAQKAEEARQRAGDREKEGLRTLDRLPELSAQLNVAGTQLASARRAEALHTLEETEAALSLTSETSVADRPEVVAIVARAGEVRQQLQVAERTAVLAVASAALDARTGPLERARGLVAAEGALANLKDTDAKVTEMAGRLSAARMAALAPLGVLGQPAELARLKLKDDIDARHSTETTIALDDGGQCLAYLLSRQGVVRGVYSVAANRVNGGISQPAAARVVRDALGAAALLPSLKAPAGRDPRHSTVFVGQSKISLGWVDEKLIELWVGEVEL